MLPEPDKNIDLSNTQLYVRAQILRENNELITDEDHVGLINLLLHSLFSEVDITLSGTLVTSSNNTYENRSYLEAILSYGSGAKTSQLTTALYYKDRAGYLDDANPYDETPLGNHGFRGRSVLMGEGRVVDMLGCIHSDLFFSRSFSS